MNSQQFDNLEPARVQRMTEQETQAVIALWQQEQIEQGGLTNKPALPDVAEGLGISVDDARRLLEQVRSQRSAEEKLLAREQAEAEWEQIRLDEEERKLNEVRRQRAELQRQRAGNERLQEGLWQNPQRTRQTNRSEGHTTAYNGYMVLLLITLAIAITTGLTYFVTHPYSDSASPSGASDVSTTNHSQ